MDTCAVGVFSYYRRWLPEPKLSKEMGLKIRIQSRAYAPQPNWGFNADANIGHAFGIFMAYVGTLRASRSGAG